MNTKFAVRATIAVAMLLVPAISANPTRADTIELSSGQTLQGEVLKEGTDAIFIDVGVDVIRIPVPRIKARTRSAESASPPAEVRRAEMYSTAKLPVKGIDELTAELGEGVVLVQTPHGLGSGFFINAEGYCVTNYHVIERETQIAVTIYQRGSSGEFTKRRIDDVRIVALNPFFDLALLQAPVDKDLKLKALYLTEQNDHKEGDPVFAIGNPLGLERSVSQGIVSNRNRSFEGLVFIQTTTQINPGNSGGPLFNARGEVVGVTNMKIAFGEGLGFAIPAAYLKHFLDNRDAFAYDKNSPNTGFRYLEAPRRRNAEPPPKE
jgi:serine protease Do